MNQRPWIPAKCNRFGFCRLLEIQFSTSADRFQRFTMEDELWVVSEENRSAHVVAFKIWGKIGSSYESGEEAGICHFGEHVFFKKAEKQKPGWLEKLNHASA